MPARRRILIMGAAGRDFHNFNVVYRGDSSVEVVAFTAAQIPGISGRRYPPQLAGPLYPEGIPIHDEADLGHLCRSLKVDEVVFAYSDVEHGFVMHKASIALATGADFSLLGPGRTMLVSKRPVIAVCAVRTGVGKSQTTRWLSRLLRTEGIATGVIRHPMPYGDLASQTVQRFASAQDLDTARCTIEEREEYEPHLAAGSVVYAGVDYGRILERAEDECRVILWDGGNNDFPFVKPDLMIVLVDPLRPLGATTHHPGEAVLRMADAVVVAKTNTATEADIRRTIETARALAPDAPLFRAQSLISLDRPELVRGRRVVVVDDGPTLTHGGMAFGAGYVAATDNGASHIVDPRPAAVGKLAEIFRRFPHLGNVLPAMGYSPAEIDDLCHTLNRCEADAIVAGTPADLARLMQLDKPVARARYEFAEAGKPGLAAFVRSFLDRYEANIGQPIRPRA